MQVKSIADSAILSTFIKLPFVFKTFVLSIFEWPLKTGFTVYILRGATSELPHYYCIIVLIDLMLANRADLEEILILVYSLC